MTDPSARTEPPTPRAIRRARERGDVPRSATASLAFAWVGLCLGLGAATGGEAWLRFATRIFSLKGFESSPLALTEAASIGGEMMLAPMLGIVAMGGLAAWAVAGRVVLTPVGVDFRRLAPRLRERWDGPARLGQLMAAALVGAVLVDLVGDASGLFGRVGGSADTWLRLSTVLSEAVLVRVAVVLALAGTVATGFARVRFWQRQRMTRRERLREERETQGDPAFRRRRHARHRASLDAPARAELLRDADLVVRGDGLVVVLTWDDRQTAPRIAAAIAGPAGARLVLEASRIPHVHDPSLALLLARLPRGSEVPERAWPRIARPLARAPRGRASRVRAPRNRPRPDGRP